MKYSEKLQQFKITLTSGTGETAKSVELPLSSPLSVSSPQSWGKLFPGVVSGTLNYINAAIQYVKPEGGGQLGFRGLSRQMFRGPGSPLTISTPIKLTLDTMDNKTGMDIKKVYIKVLQLAYPREAIDDDPDSIATQTVDKISTIATNTLTRLSGDKVSEEDEKQKNLKTDIATGIKQEIIAAPPIDVSISIGNIITLDNCFIQVGGATFSDTLDIDGNPTTISFALTVTTLTSITVNDMDRWLVRAYDNTPDEVMSRQFSGPTIP